jgi:hypothetical protein
MQNEVQDDILDDKEYPTIRTLSLTILELIIITFTIVSISVFFAPLTYDILVTSDTAPTDGDKTGLLLFVFMCIIKLLPFTFVLLFFRASNDKYLDKEKAFESPHFDKLQKCSEYVACFYLAFGALMTVLYGFSDYRVLYTIPMALTGVVILIYTKKTGVYIKN